MLGHLDSKDQKTPGSSQREETPHAIATTDTALSLDTLEMSGTKDESGDGEMPTDTHTVHTPFKGCILYSNYVVVIV